jgi:uncharacterized OB-fold protein
MRLLGLLADGGRATEPRVHRECRDCGTNVAPDVESCPECGGSVAVYSL